MVFIPNRLEYKKIEKEKKLKIKSFEEKLNFTTVKIKKKRK